MNRFHATTVLAALLVLLAVGLDNTVMLALVTIAYVIVVGGGVALPQLKFFGPYLCRGSADFKCVALTFDDGPDPRSTPALLDLLRERDVEAAFFCIGKYIDAEPLLAARIAHEGHLLGNHTYTHNSYTNFFTEARLRDELVRTQGAIEEAAGVITEWFRPPVGLTNPRVFRAAQKLSLKVTGWTVRSLDTKLADPQRIVDRIGRGLKPGAIILLHDGNIPADRLVATVKLLLDRLQTLGYEVVRLDHLLK
jgi:peptidoglycan-N-acetylglucosamine deacetylase